MAGIKRDSVLVTGATGFVGANLVRAFVSKGYRVNILTRRTSNKWRLHGISSKVKNFTSDLLDTGRLKRIVRKIKPDIVLHLANAGVYGGRSLSDREMAYVNLVGSINLIEACREIDYRCFVNTGSSSEYGLKNEPMKESDTCYPISGYGVSKYAATLYAGMEAETKGKPIFTLRLFSPFGPYDDRRRFISYAIINALKNNNINLLTPYAVRDYIYIEDVIDLYFKCIDKAGEIRGEVFNVGSGKQVSVSEVLGLIMKITGSKSRVIRNSKKKPLPFEPKRWQADISKARKIFKWSPSFDIQSGLEETVRWFRENISFYK